MFFVEKERVRPNDQFSDLGRFAWANSHRFLLNAIEKEELHYENDWHAMNGTALVTRLSLNNKGSYI